jgi:hypothetical protein
LPDNGNALPIWKTLMDQGAAIAHLVTPIDAVSVDDAERGSRQTSELHDLVAQASSLPPKTTELRAAFWGWQDERDRALRLGTALRLDCALERLPVDPGIYVLVLTSTRPGTIMVGRRGWLDRMTMQCGFYVHIDSATPSAPQAPHHARRIAKLKWHIDYCGCCAR